MDSEAQDYQAYLDELESINQEFLLRNYTTAWLGCIELLIKLLSLPSSQTSSRSASPITTYNNSGNKTSDNPNSSNSNITLIEEWKQTYSPPFVISEGHRQSKFHLWVNVWSLLITVVGKETYSGSSLESTDFSSILGHGFTQADISKMESYLLGMERSLIGIWRGLVSFYSPEIYTIPSDLILGLMLVAIKKQSFTFAESVAVTWTQSIPNSWRQQLQKSSVNMNWEVIESDSEAEGIERLCQHYDSIQTLYIAHALVGQARWASIPGVISKDSVLSKERQQNLNDLVEQAYQEFEASQQITLDQPPQSAAALASKSSVSQTSSQTSSLATEPPPLLTRFQSWSRNFFTSDKLTPAVVSAIAALIFALWITKRNSSNNKSRAMIWILRIIRSLRPALPPTSGPAAVA